MITLFALDQVPKPEPAAASGAHARHGLDHRHGHANFLERRTPEVRRIYLLGTSVNKGKGRLPCPYLPPTSIGIC